MKSFLIVGTGTFGHHLCHELSKTKCDIMIADQSSDAMDDLLPLVVSAKVGDCTNIDVLRSFGIPSFDACFVCVKSDFQACLEITDQLKELGAKKIYSKADRELEAKFLTRAGADRIIFPEREAAARIADSESSDRIFDFIQLAENYAICEISPRAEWVGHTVAELGFRAKYGLNLVAAKKGTQVRPVLDPGYTFSADEHVLVLGSITDVRKAT